MTVLPNIAFIGRAGAGKTTAREYLEEAFGYERISFAAPLKVGCGTTNDRGLLQRVGQGVRELHEDFWVNLLLDEVRGTPNDDFAWANDDTRYPNEATALKAEGFVIVRVAAPRALRLDRLRINGRLQDEAQLNHVSETSLDDFAADFEVINAEDTDELQAQLNWVVNRCRS